MFNGKTEETGKRESGNKCGDTVNLNKMCGQNTFYG